MASTTKIIVFLGISLALLLQLPIVRRLGTLLRLGLAIGKTIQPIGDFPDYQCRRIHYEHLQACEDIWLSGPTRQLFLACSDTQVRNQWQPNEGAFNFTSRSTQDTIAIMDLETLASKRLPMVGFTGTQNDGIINLTGFSAVDGGDGSTDLMITNFRPSLDPATGQFASNQAAIGANVTIEVFKKRAGVDELEYLRTLVDPLITTPNRIAAVGGRGMYITNDHGAHKSGLLSTLSPILQTGNVVFCSTDASPSCKIVSTGHSYPNGLIHSLFDQNIYVPSSAQGGIKVFRSHPNGSLELTQEIDLPYAIDNLSEDQNGDIWAAVIPDGVQFFKHSNDPYNRTPPSAVFRFLRRGSGGFEVKKVLEDRDGVVLPGATTVVHDARTGRLFLSGMFSPFITVCEPKT